MIEHTSPETDLVRRVDHKSGAMMIVDRSSPHLNLRDEEGALRLSLQLDEAGTRILGLNREGEKVFGIPDDLSVTESQWEEQNSEQP